MGDGVTQPDGLIDILLDRGERIDVRDDAAMYLDKYDDPRAEDALLEVASDRGEDYVVAASAGESLGEIWARKGRIPPDGLKRLRPDARAEAAAILRKKAEWLLP